MVPREKVVAVVVVPFNFLFTDPPVEEGIVSVYVEGPDDTIKLAVTLLFPLMVMFVGFVLPLNAPLQFKN